jgi:hypothetical protein
MMGVGSRVLVSKQPPVAHSESTGADDQLLSSSCIGCRLAEVEYGIKRRGYSGSEGATDRARCVSAHSLAVLLLQFATALGLADANPVGRLIGGALKAGVFYEGFQKDWPVMSTARICRTPPRGCEPAPAAAAEQGRPRVLARRRSTAAGPRARGEVPRGCRGCRWRPASLTRGKAKG